MATFVLSCSLGQRYSLSLAFENERALKLGHRAKERQKKDCHR